MIRLGLFQAALSLLPELCDDLLVRLAKVLRNDNESVSVEMSFECATKTYVVNLGAPCSRYGHGNSRPLVVDDVLGFSHG